MAIAVGDTLPDATLKIMTGDGPADIETGSLFAGKTLVLFAVPGAFTPTCTLNHLPGYVENAESILAKGIDGIACLSVNDPFVVKAWAEQSGGKEKLHFLSDWDASFTKQIGMDMDMSAAGLGVRSKRYAMIVKDGKVAHLAIEDGPGKADKSGAAAMLEHLASA